MRRTSDNIMLTQESLYQAPLVVGVYLFMQFYPTLVGKGNAIQDYLQSSINHLNHVKILKYLNKF